jgi:hypothetical protein
MDNLETRIEMLERSARVHQLLTGAMLLLACGAVVLTQRRVRGDDLEARELSIVDDEGKKRVRIGRLAEAGYGLTLSDGSGRARALFQLQSDGSPRLSFGNPSGQSLAELAVFQSAPRLLFANDDGVEFFSLTLEMDGSSRMSLVEQNGRSRIILGASGDGSPGLVLVDRYGRALAELTLSADSSKLVLQGRNGNVFKAPAE